MREPEVSVAEHCCCDCAPFGRPSHWPPPVLVARHASSSPRALRNPAKASRSAVSLTIGSAPRRRSHSCAACAHVKLVVPKATSVGGAGGGVLASSKSHASEAQRRRTMPLSLRRERPMKLTDIESAGCCCSPWCWLAACPSSPPRTDVTSTTRHSTRSAHEALQVRSAHALQVPTAKLFRRMM